ncbi:MAG: hypothetical protein HY807_07220 [Nitrospirae bacterium]|nr:hypothetical protein [Nitrospirota bacterium]
MTGEGTRNILDIQDISEDTISEDSKMTEDLSRNKRMMTLANIFLKKRAGRCLIVFIIIMGLLSLGAMWLVTKLSIMRQEKIAEKRTEQTTQNTTEHDWKTIANSLTSKYQGKILSIILINTKTCRVKLSPGLTDLEAVAIAANIGRDIRNLTAGINTATPFIQVFVNGKLAAVARPEGEDYIGEVSR